MTEDLKPCPFCGNIPVLSDDGWTHTWTVECPHFECYVNPQTVAFGRERAIAAWNTRAERTCTWEVVKGGCIYDVYACSACGYEYAESRCDNGVKTEICDAKYCPNCGAKVV